MTISECYLFKNYLEHWPIDRINEVPSQIRGIYVLFNSVAEKNYSVVYIGMARGGKMGVKGRLRRHRRKKADQWTHFSVFEVWDNITKEQVEELEGLFRHIYHRDPEAQKFNVQRSYRPLIKLRRRSVENWQK
jgi:hypothetical protein